MIKQIVIEGQTFGGSVQARIVALEAHGYNAERQRENPHAFWQQAEHYKRSLRNENNNRR